jgi:hypothetical protein
MLLNSDIDLPQLIFGFGVALFLALVCLLRLQHRRELARRARLDQGLRNYVAEQTQEAVVAGDAHR